MPPLLRGPVRAAHTSPGKRVRGILTLASAELCGAKPEVILDAAVAFEMIHASSLILDDLPAMDDAELRRGEPTIHRTFGDDLAILSAVSLLNHAYALLADAFEKAKPKRTSLSKIIRLVVGAVGWDGSIAGEVVDLHSEQQNLDFKTLEYIHSRKTGALFVAAAICGGMLGDASPRQLESLEAYAKNLGLAFQITDDILDVTGSVETLGKDIGKDDQRLTFVKLAGVDGARQLNEELIATALSALAPLGERAAPLRLLAMSLRDRIR